MSYRSFRKIGSDAAEKIFKSDSFSADIITVLSSLGKLSGFSILSALLYTLILGIPPQPSSLSRESVTSACSSPSSALISIILIIISAVAASSRVLLNASISWWGVS